MVYTLLVDSLSTINIALLFLYAVSLRFILFDYVISATIWQELLEVINEKVISSTKTTTKKGDLIIYSPDSKPNIFWKGLYKVIEKLIKCSFCKGCWAGYIVYLLLVINYNYLTLDFRQIIDFALFSWSCGVLSLLSTSRLGL